LITALQVPLAARLRPGCPLHSFFDMTTDSFDLPDRRGWVMLVLPPSYGAFDDPSPDNPAAATQATASVTECYQARYSAGTAASWEPAAVIANAHCPTTARPKNLPRRRLSGS
jgi:hypothetical protein